jgi:glucose-1-phosphate cytidylyltransferase
MKTVILCGGAGAQGESLRCPKPLVEIAEKPILLHIVNRYVLFGFREFVLCLCDRHGMIAERLSAIEWPRDVSIEMVDMGTMAGAGGHLSGIRERLSDEGFMVTYGDVLADIDIRQLVRFHHMHGKIATVSTVLPQNRLGCEIHSGDRNLKWPEKKRMDSWVTAGFFVFRSTVFHYLDSDGCSGESLSLKRLVRVREVMAYRHSGYFITADTVGSVPLPAVDIGLSGNVSAGIFS